MTPARYHTCLAVIGWTPHGLAAALNVHETRTRRWGTGQAVIPPDVAAWLELAARFHERHPPPRRG